MLARSVHRDVCYANNTFCRFFSIPLVSVLEQCRRRCRRGGQERRSGAERPGALRRTSCHLLSLHNTGGCFSASASLRKRKRQLIERHYSRAIHCGMKKSLWGILNYAKLRYIWHYNSWYLLATDFAKIKFTTLLLLMR